MTRDEAMQFDANSLIRDTPEVMHALVMELERLRVRDFDPVVNPTCAILSIESMQNAVTYLRRYREEI